jgi:histidine triad (HIT) family protein
MELDMKSLFEKIIDGELPAEKLYENDKLIVIKDIHPKAPVHLLIITKKKIHDLQSMQEEDFPLLGEVVKAAQKLARDLGLDQRGYRLLVNNGREAGQSIFHLHFHFLAGQLFTDID